MNKILLTTLFTLLMVTSTLSHEVVIFRGTGGILFSRGLDVLGKRLEDKCYTVEIFDHYSEEIHSKGSIIIGFSYGGVGAYKLAKRPDFNPYVFLIDPINEVEAPKSIGIVVNIHQQHFKKWYGKQVINVEIEPTTHSLLDNNKSIHDFISNQLRNLCPKQLY